MAQDNHKIGQGEKLRRMATTTKALREQKKAAPPSAKVHLPPEDIERLKELTPSVLPHRPLPPRKPEDINSEPLKDGWEMVTEYLKELKGSAWRVIVLLFYVLVIPLGIKIAVELTAPRVTLSYFHTYLIAAGIATIVLLYLRLSHKTKVTNKDDE